MRGLSRCVHCAQSITSLFAPQKNSLEAAVNATGYQDVCIQIFKEFYVNLIHAPFSNLLRYFSDTTSLFGFIMQPRGKRVLAGPRLLVLSPSASLGDEPAFNENKCQLRPER